MVLFFGLITLLSLTIVGGTANPSLNNSTLQIRSAETCADPSQTVTFIQQYHNTGVTFALNTAAGFAFGVTAEGQTSDWHYSGDVFLGWVAPDPNGFTTALYHLFNSATLDWMVALAQPNGNPPAVPTGYVLNTLFGYVYSSQVCGSVPLLGASNPAVGSHWYTTKLNDHAQLLSEAGWVDAGIAAYVLPLSATAW